MVFVIAKVAECLQIIDISRFTQNLDGKGRNSLRIIMVPMLEV